MTTEAQRLDLLETLVKNLVKANPYYPDIVCWELGEHSGHWCISIFLDPDDGGEYVELEPCEEGESYLVTSDGTILSHHFPNGVELTLSEIEQKVKAFLADLPKISEKYG